MRIGSILSPGWQAPAPKLTNVDSGIGECRNRRRTIWSAGDFAERSVDVHADENCWMLGRGIIFDGKKDLLPHSVGRANSSEEIASADLEIHLAERPQISLDSQCVVLKRPGETCYGHWLGEILPRLEVARKFAGNDVHVVISKHTGLMANVCRESIALLGVDESKIIETRAVTCQLKCAITVPHLTLTGEPLLSPLIRATFDYLAHSADAAGMSKIFVDRPEAMARKIVNHAEVVDAFKRRNFHIIEPQTLSFRDQISVFKSARVIAGVMGSALTNMCFAKSGASVLAIAPEAMVDPFFWQLAAICGHDYSELIYRNQEDTTHRRPWDAPFTVDIAELNQWLEAV